MIDMITIVLFILAFVSLIVSTIAIGWLSMISKHLSGLGKRVLESEDVGRVIQAADNTASFESRISDCERSRNESQDKLAEHETKLNEVTDKQGTAQQIINRHAADLANTSEKLASFEIRFNDFENNIGDKLNKLQEYDAKVNELTSKLQMIEQTTKQNEAGFAEADRSIKTIRDGIDNLEKFRASIEKTRSLILSAFTDIQATAPSGEALGMASEITSPTGEDMEAASEITKPEESSQEPEGEYHEVEDQATPGRYNLDL
jgi:chromosome segregation ATPase